MAWTKKRVQGWKDQIGKYETQTRSPQDILSEAGCLELYQNCSQEEDKKHRELFLDYLAKRRKAGLPKKATGKVNTKTISMKKLLGPEGVKLYKAAILEEKNSKVFRDAVFMRATHHYEGAKWNNRLILWIGGPSSSGKTHVTKPLVAEIAKEMESSSQNKSGNDVISVDGSIEREVSQMRQMVLQVALSRGYKGIQDLHKNTKLSTKRHVQEATLATEGLSMVIPSTFTRPVFLGQLPPEEKYNGMNNTVQVYSEVVAEKGQEERFQTSVAIGGNSRAWRKSDKLFKGIKMNNFDIGCESKEYQGRYFSRGVNRSRRVRENFQKNPNVRTFQITNDLIYFKEVQKGEASSWKKCTLEDAENTSQQKIIKMTARDFQEWKHHGEGKSLEEWAKKCEDNPASVLIDKMPPSLSERARATTILTNRIRTFTSGFIPQNRRDAKIPSVATSPPSQVDSVATSSQPTETLRNSFIISGGPSKHASFASSSSISNENVEKDKKSEKISEIFDRYGEGMVEHVVLALRMQRANVGISSKDLYEEAQGIKLKIKTELKKSPDEFTLEKVISSLDSDLVTKLNDNNRSSQGWNALMTELNSLIKPNRPRIGNP